MAKSSRKRRSSPNKSQTFERGCCLSGCLLYMGCGGVLLLVLGLLAIGLIAAFISRVAPAIDNIIAPITFFLMFSPSPGLIIATGVAQLLMVVAIWRGYRWGVYALVFLAVANQICYLWGATSISDIWNGMLSFSWNNIPLIILLLLIRPKWKTMR